MQKIMVDMDEVLCEGGNIGVVNAFLKTNYKMEDLPGYYAEDVVPKDRFEEYSRFFATQNIYDYVTKMPDVVEVLEKLSKKYEIFICTAYYTDAYSMDYRRLLLDKYDWLEKNFPFILPSHYVFINDKSLLECDIKIDDRLDNLKGYGTTKLLFDSYHNQELTEEELNHAGVIRVSGWKEIEKLLLSDVK